ncbi:hypothetical protein KQ940_22270 [Marinobacterium sp. D7]|uniref:hypothetical protein n=1 Tax=Marinobacterium ramblicola TaxID=2849041 RepID=UPI001C2CE793|nr:hypothetical protein [Marinobacterium ramblicola]MBV1790797.1 hypothetical protein [Marinobacterium ramblicola]
MKGTFGVAGILDGWKKGDVPGNQMVDIVVKSHSTIRDGLISISAQLANDDEVDYAIDELIKDLESVRKKAKDNIRKTNERIRNS